MLLYAFHLGWTMLEFLAEAEVGHAVQRTPMDVEPAWVLRVPPGHAMLWPANNDIFLLLTAALLRPRLRAIRFRRHWTLLIVRACMQALFWSCRCVNLIRATLETLAVWGTFGMGDRKSWDSRRP